MSMALWLRKHWKTFKADGTVTVLDRTAYLVVPLGFLTIYILYRPSLVAMCMISFPLYIIQYCGLCRNTGLQKVT